MVMIMIMIMIIIIIIIIITTLFKQLKMYQFSNDEKVVIDLIDFGKSFQSFAAAY